MDLLIRFILNGLAPGNHSQRKKTKTAGSDLEVYSRLSPGLPIIPLVELGEGVDTGEEAFPLEIDSIKIERRSSSDIEYANLQCSGSGHLKLEIAAKKKGTKD